jgi:alkaline phosphatase D
MQLNRRSLLAAGALASFPRAAWASGFSAGAFTHGVASGDPLPDSVILWTRFAHNGAGRIGWQIAGGLNGSTQRIR